MVYTHNRRMYPTSDAFSPICYVILDVDIVSISSMAPISTPSQMAQSNLLRPSQVNQSNDSVNLDRCTHASALVYIVLLYILFFLIITYLHYHCLPIHIYNKSILLP